MNILFIYRSKKNNAFSIENVFDNITENLQNQGFEISKYYKEGSLIKTIKDLRKLSPDHYHITGDVYYLALFLPLSKTSMTVHDIGSYKNHKKNYRILLIGLIWFFLPMFFLKKFTVISDFVKLDIKRFFHINPKKITVINNPLTIEIDKSLMKKNGTKVKILQIGTGSHKNLNNLIQAVTNLENIQILIIGDPDNTLVDNMLSNNIDFVVYKNISRDKVISIYKESNFLFFASFSEGFGLPILEAQALGRPVITSKLSPMVEVGGDAVLLVNPYDTNEIRSTIIRLINDDILYENLVKKGFVNVKRYDPKKIGTLYSEFFKRF